MSAEHEERRPLASLAPSETSPEKSTSYDSAAGSSPRDIPALDDLDVIHHAWLAGYDQGLAHGQRMAIEHLAHELLHRQSAEVARMAVETAMRRHGDGWASLMRDQSEAVD